MDKLFTHSPFLLATHAFVDRVIWLWMQVTSKDSTELLENEGELVQQAQDGNQQAFSALYEHYFPRIYKFIMKRCGHQQLAEDITSQTFMKALQHLSSFKAKGHPFGAWLYRIASNTLTDHYKKSSTKSEFVQETMPDAKDDRSGAHEELMQSELRENLLSILKDLKHADQEVLHLRFFAELSVKEISEVLKISENAASVRIYRGLKSLKKLVEKDSSLTMDFSL